MRPSPRTTLAVVAAAALLVSAATPAPSPASADVEVLEEVPATGNDLRAPQAHNSPDLAVDPTDDRFVALASRMDSPDFSCQLQVSGDGGRGWVPAAPVPELPDGVDKCYAPEVGFDAAGTLYYLFVGLAGPGNRPRGVYLTTSDDRAVTFTDAREVLGPGNYQVRMAVDPTVGEQGRIHLVWLQTSAPPTLGGLPTPPNPIVAAYSDDGGATFSDPVPVSHSDRLRVVAPALALGADGTLHVVYYDLGDDVRDYQGLEGPVWPDTWTLVHTVSVDRGASFRGPTVVDDQLQPPERVMLIFTMPPPALAVDADGGVYTAWHDARNGDWDVLAARSTDRGATWDRPVRVNDDEPGNGAHQLLPQLAVAPDGRVEAIWLDRRDDPDNVRQHVYQAPSSDRAATFGPNVRVTRFSSTSTAGAQYAVPSARGKVEHGLRLALIADDAGTLAAWPDSRHALPGTAQQEVFTSRVRQPTATGPAWWLAAVAGLLVLGGLVARQLRRRRSRAADHAVPPRERADP